MLVDLLARAWAYLEHLGDLAMDAFADDDETETT